MIERFTSSARVHLLIVMLLMLAAPAGHAMAQGDSGGDVAANAGERGGTGNANVGGDSFASAFFWSTRTNNDGERSLELLGSFIIWLLLILSLLSIGLIIMMSVTNTRKTIAPEGVVEECKRLLTAAQYREAMELTAREPSFFSQILHAGLNEASHGYSAVIRALEQSSDELTTIRLRRIEYLNVLGQVSPMLGLLGTVYGMILAFGSIVASGGNADPILLAGGIGTALTTTFWGLVVAIPALAGYAIIRNRIDELTTDATLRAEELLNQFRPKPQGAKAAGEAKPSPRPVKA